MPVFYLSISLLLYLLALFFDGALMGGERHMPALQMLLYGPWGMPFGLYQWFANPLLALAILAHRRFRRLALLAGLLYKTPLGVFVQAVGVNPAAARASFRNSASSDTRTGVSMSNCSVFTATVRDSSGSQASCTWPRPPLPRPRAR